MMIFMEFMNDECCMFAESQYLGAVLGAVTWFVVFYVIALFISIVYALT